MSNHTPGPWRVVDRRNRDWAALHIDAQPDSKGTYSVASVGGVADMPESEREANARLIAAATQLLEALEAWEAWAQHGDNALQPGVYARLGQTKAAIAAARVDGR